MKGEDPERLLRGREFGHRAHVRLWAPHHVCAERLLALMVRHREACSTAVRLLL